MSEWERVYGPSIGKRHPEYDGMTTEDLIADFIRGVPLDGIHKFDRSIARGLMAYFQIIPNRVIYDEQAD